MLSFSKAPAVAKGDPITSKQFSALAKSFNDRIRSGVGDAAWRIGWCEFNLWRQPRNPSADGFVFPSQAEFFDIFQHLESETDLGSTWPVTGPGEPEGINLANVMGQFVFGLSNPNDPASGLDSEDIRLNFGLPFLRTPDPTIEDYWDIGKAQRGVYEPTSGAQNTPAFDRAQDFFRVVQPYWSPHGKAYGGWLPSPVQLLSNCGGTPITGQGTPSYEIKFTALQSGLDTSSFHGSVAGDPAVVTYAGSCPCGSDNGGAGHVLGIAYAPFVYYVFVADGTGDIVNGCGYDVDVFPIADWIEGPYTGEGRLKHTVSNKLARSLWAFQTDFHGTPGQRTPDTFKIESIAFDNQDFFTRQYPLAPNIGVVEGAELVGVYPRVEFDAGVSKRVKAGTRGTFAEGATHVYAVGFVLGGVFAKATLLKQTCSVEFLDGTEVIAKLILTPDQNGAALAVKFLKDAGQVELRIRLSDDAVFTSADGQIVCEATEQLEYKPQFWDAYLVSRFGASFGGSPIVGGVDGRGKDTDFAKSIFDNFIAVGAINNYAGVRAQAEWINSNPVFDAARRVSKAVRVLRRQQLVSYEVTGGKSVLYFKRYPQVPGIDGREVGADMFAGIAPPVKPVNSGELIEGETYIARAASGRIIYRGAAYSNNATFTATTEKEFQTHGDALLYVRDGIRQTALKKGLTNEWVGFLQTKCYHPSPTSVWKPDAYPDYFAWCNRCHFYSGTAPSLLKHFFNYNHSTSPLDPDTFTPILNDMAAQAQFVSPEAPPGYNYAAGSNTDPDYITSDFLKSCQIYEAPFEIEGCVVDYPETPPEGGDWAAEQIIKVTLKSRLRAHADAPAIVDKDPLTWSTGERDALAGESYRTPDNAVREYLLSLVDGGRNCTFKTGDAGIASLIADLPDNPFGSCYPHFFLVQLVGEPFDDDNDSQESHDTRCTVDEFQKMEFYLRAMCEGFVDARTSKEIICDTGLGNLYDYTFENLCFDAFGGRWIGAFSLASRPDSPTGYGPLPNTLMYADVFNRLSSAVNLLDKARLDLPLQFMAREYRYYDERDITLIELTGICTTVGTCAAYQDNIGVPFATTLDGSTSPNPTDWAAFTTISSDRGGNLTGCPYKVSGGRKTTEYRVEVLPDFLDAVPTELQELIENNQTGFLVDRSKSVGTYKRESVSEPDADRCPLGGGGGAHWTEGTEHYRWTSDPVGTTDCIFVSSGLLEADPPPPFDGAIGRTGSIPETIFCGSGSSTSVALNLIAESNAFIQVPVSDLNE